MPTNEELIQEGKKALALKEKDKARTRAKALAIKMLITAHQEEYEELPMTSLSSLGPYQQGKVPHVSLLAKEPKFRPSLQT